MESKDTLQDPDGTIVERAGGGDKGSFHTKTEKWWDDAFVKAQRPELMPGPDIRREDVKLSDDSLV